MITIDYAMWGWAQWVMIALIAFEIIAAAVMHGSPRKPVHVGNYIINSSLILILLIFGGFFS